MNWIVYTYSTVNGVLNCHAYWTTDGTTVLSEETAQTLANTINSEHNGVTAMALPLEVFSV